MWLARDKNRVDVLIGNPPWLAYRHMTGDMQKVFRKMSEERGLWAGADVATHQDLSALFRDLRVLSKLVMAGDNDMVAFGKPQCNQGAAVRRPWPNRPSTIRWRIEYLTRRGGQRAAEWQHLGKVK
jgi:methylase of polypeptide subunit release factors